MEIISCSGVHSVDLIEQRRYTILSTVRLSRNAIKRTFFYNGQLFYDRLVLYALCYRAEFPIAVWEKRVFGVFVFLKVTGL